jgi:glycosyltransferase involved in cell wall biosynthesis
LTGGRDKPYALGLVGALASKGVSLDVIAGDDLDRPEFDRASNIHFFNLRGDQSRDARWRTKVSRVLRYYARLTEYAFNAEPKVFHILWNNKVELIDRTVVMLYYKLLGKKIALTVHNVNAGQRDANDNALNRLTLRTQYLLADHIFTHTAAMKRQLQSEFGVRESAITVVPFGINSTVPQTSLTSGQARERLGIPIGARVLLFFGNIAPYKGLEYLVDAFQRLTSGCKEYLLIIAGSPKKNFEKYWEAIRDEIRRRPNDRIVNRIEYIPDEDTEVYFKSADVLILPYTEIFQSGVLFLGYGFGLPVVATDVGCLREDIVEGETGFVAKDRDAGDLARAIDAYFASDLFKGLASRRQSIRSYAAERHSWDTVGEKTKSVYLSLLGAEAAMQSATS